MVTTRAPPPRGPRWLFCPRSPAQGQRAPLGPDRRNAGRKLRAEHREHPKHRGSRLPPASWGQGGEHTRKSVEEGGWDLGGETSGGAKRAGISLRQASFLACSETTVSAAPASAAAPAPAAAAALAVLGPVRLGSPAASADML